MILNEEMAKTASVNLCWKEEIRKNIRGSVCRLRDEDGSPVESMEGPDGRVW